MMTREELELDLRESGFRIVKDDAYGPDGFTATKDLFNWNTSVVKLRLSAEFNGTLDGRSNAYIELIHDHAKCGALIPTSDDGKSFPDWRPYAKTIVEEYLDELGKVYARLAEFNMTGT